MINFCLTIILLSVFRNILCQINEELILSIDKKLEYAHYTCMGVVIFLSELAKPTKTEIALYQKQKELAIENARLISERVKTVLKAVYTHVIIRSFPLL